MEPNSSYFIMSEGPNDYCCSAAAAIHAIFGQRGHTRANWQQIKAGGENFPEMFPGNTNISK